MGLDFDGGRALGVVGQGADRDASDEPARTGRATAATGDGATGCSAATAEDPAAGRNATHSAVTTGANAAGAG
jgi:hypothetical protein